MSEEGVAKADGSEEQDSRLRDDDGTPLFAYFSLEGERFQTDGLPTANAIEVEHFRAAVFAFARELWLQDNPDRHNVPPGFEAAFDLRLKRVGRGSAQPRLVLHRSSSAKEEWFPYFEQGRDQVTEALTAAKDFGEVPADVEQRVRPTLRTLGRTLATDEQLVVGPPTRKAPRAVLDASTRAILRQIAEVTAPTYEEAKATGVIVEYDSAGPSFRLVRASDDLLIECRMPDYVPGLQTRAKRYLAADGVTAPDVEVTGFATLDLEGRFRVLSEVTAIEFVRSYAEKRLRRKVEHLKGLPHGWRGPNSTALDATVKRRLDEALDVMGALDVHVAVAPSEEGHVVFEWSRGGATFVAEIESDDHLYLYVNDRGSGRLEDLETEFSVEMLERFARDGVIDG